MKETRHTDETKVLQENMITSLQQGKKDYDGDSSSTAANIWSDSIKKGIGSFENLESISGTGGSISKLTSGGFKCLGRS